MGDFIEDSIEALKFGFSWYKDPENIKSYVAFVIAYVVVFAAVIAAIGIPLFKSISNPSIMTRPELSPAFFLWMAMALITISVLFWVFQMFVIAPVMVRGMNSLGITAKFPDSNKILGALLLSIIVAFKSVFCWYDKRWLAALFLAIILPILNRVLIIFSVLVFFAYIFAVIYYSIRLWFSLFVYFSRENVGYSEATDTSFALTSGHVIGVFARNLIAGFFAGVIIGLLALVPSLILGAIDYLIGFPLFQKLFDAVIAPIQVFTGLYIQAYIYSSVLQWNKIRAGPEPIKRGK
ncbi:MAG: hypothetical protein V1835_03870 [Candidatus Micrarchaeota archaeon]